MPFPEEYNENYNPWESSSGLPAETFREAPSWSYTQGALPYESPIPSVPSSYPTPYGSTSPTQFTSRPSYGVGGGYGGAAPTSGYAQTSKGQYARLGDQPFFIPNKTGIAPGGQVYTYGIGTGQGISPTGGTPSAPGTGEFSFPELKLPTLDESRISELEQKAASPGIRELRKSVREVQGKYYENPNVKRMTLRDALAGYGAGLEKVMTGARRQAREEYEMEYRPALQKAQLEWQAKVQGLMAQYQNTWRDYMARLNAATMG